MDLKDFVSETLLSIIQGVNDAQEKAKELGAHINPGGLMRSTSNISSNAIWDNTTNNYAQPVAFDVAITAEDSAKGGAKVKVLSGILGGDIGGEKGSKNVIASRVQFTVPLLLPAHNIEKPNARKLVKRQVTSKGVRR
jgi:hypothetical protein